MSRKPLIATSVCLLGRLVNVPQTCAVQTKKCEQASKRICGAKTSRTTENKTVGGGRGDATFFLNAGIQKTFPAADEQHT